MNLIDLRSFGHLPPVGKLPDNLLQSHFDSAQRTVKRQLPDGLYDTIISGLDICAAGTIELKASPTAGSTLTVGYKTVTIATTVTDPESEVLFSASRTTMLLRIRDWLIPRLPELNISSQVLTVYLTAKQPGPAYCYEISTSAPDKLIVPASGFMENVNPLLPDLTEAVYCQTMALLLPSMHTIYAEGINDLNENGTSTRWMSPAEIDAAIERYRLRAAELTAVISPAADLPGNFRYYEL